MVLYIQIIRFYLIYINSIFATHLNLFPKVNPSINANKLGTHISINQTSGS